MESRYSLFQGSVSKRLKKMWNLTPLQSRTDLIFMLYPVSRVGSGAQSQLHM